MVERWCRELTDKVIRRGVFVNMLDLEALLAAKNSSLVSSSGLGGRHRWKTREGTCQVRGD